jgi:GT2 family glycosyltransferase
MSPSVSAVIPSRDEGGNLRRTVHALLATMPRDCEIVIVDDGSVDGSADFAGAAYPAVRVVRLERSVGPAAARHAGAEEAAGELLLFADAHVIPQRGWFEAFSDALADDAVGAVGPAMADSDKPRLCGFGATWRLPPLDLHWLPFRSREPQEVPLLGGAFLAMRREVYSACGGFDDGLIGWGGSDSELCARLWMQGYSCLVVPTVAVAHRFRREATYPVDPALVVHNFLRIGLVHLGADRLRRVVDHYRAQPGADRALALLAAGDTYARRAAVRATRRHDDEWFFERFAPSAS